ncbi:MAG: hypothetical protein ACKVU2_14370 [Saprospiraceae bacterium]
MKNSIVLKLAVLALMLVWQAATGCYTVRIKVSNGIPQDMPNNRTDVYRDLHVHVKDTTVCITALNKDFGLNITDCQSGGLAIVEYRNTFLGVLLSAVTFGRVRQVRFKYVCTKPSN